MLHGRGPVSRITIRAALLLGFGLTLGLWLFAGYQVTRTMARVEAETASITARYLRSQELLSTLRAQVLLGSVFVRDALLDPDPAAAEGYRRRLQEAYHVADDALQQYEPTVESAQIRERLVRLRQEIDDF